MSNEHVDPRLKELLESISQPTPSRSTQQLEVEHAIMDFSPAWDEAEELLDALIASLERKYRELDTSELPHYCKYLKQAIERLGEQIPAEQDEIDAFKDYRARKAGL